MFGVPVRERLPRTVETVAILRRAWTGERFCFDGEVFRYDRVRVTPPPAQPGGPPILLGGYVDAALAARGRDRRRPHHRRRRPGARAEGRRP